MVLVYLLTIIITGTWVIKIINHKSLIINHTPLDIPLLLFLASQILSSIFSIDRHTSIWGYYSRSNGGLLSIISFSLLYWALVSNLNKVRVIKLLKIGLVSGAIISLWGILEHFGVSPSCVILRQELNASCWVQDVAARVFATLGQPNWLATYLGMLIFPAIYFAVTSTVKVTSDKKLQLVTSYLLPVILYLAFTFTYSRGATLGLIGGMAVFLTFYFVRNTQKDSENQKIRVSDIQKIRLSDLLIHPALRVLLSFLIINLIFGSALTRFDISKLLPTSTSKVESPNTFEVSPNVTQLEAGGTESGQIRFIVWAGALDIFKHYPIFGSGVETFAYSYYQFRPIAHNLVSEWDFLYNKAHNEYLNYLSTTGIVGFGSYLFMIGTFLLWSIKYYISSIKQKNHNTYYLILTTSLLASYISYLVSNFFGFSVVITALFFFLFPAMAFVITGSTSTIHLPRFAKRALSIIYRHPKISKFFLLLVTCYFPFYGFGMLILFLVVA